MLKKTVETLKQGNLVGLPTETVYGLAGNAYSKKAVKKIYARPFNVAKNIKMMVINPVTGNKANFGSKKTIIEAYKKNKSQKNYFEESRILQYKLNDKNILKFY